MASYRVATKRILPFPGPYIRNYSATASKLDATTAQKPSQSEEGIQQVAKGKGASWKEYRPKSRIDFDELPEHVKSGFIKDGLDKVMSNGKIQNKPFLAWLWQVAAPLYYQGKGRPLYLQENQPFPRNPQFKPKAPLSEPKKQVIYKQFLNNLKDADGDEELVVKGLVDVHKLPADKIRAIIRLQELSESWKSKGIPLQSELAKGMDEALGSVNSDMKYPQDSRTVYEPGRPIFKYVDLEHGADKLPIVEKAAIYKKQGFVDTDEIPHEAETTDVFTGNNGYKKHPILRRSYELPDGDVRLIPSSKPGRSQMLVVRTDNTVKGKLWKKTYTKGQREERKKKRNEKAQDEPKPQYWLV